MSPPEYEGEMPLSIKGVSKPVKTWYKVIGDLKNGTKRPLVVCHGGPGFSYDYLDSIADLAKLHNIPVVFYDQVGGGRSTKFPEKAGDGSFWTEGLFVDELDHLLRHLDIQDDFDAVGHSWGGMLLEMYTARRQPKGLKHLVLANSLANMHTWGKSATMLVKTLPQKTQDVLSEHEEKGTTDSPEYQEAMMEFITKFVCTIVPFPESFAKTLAMAEEDMTVYHTMQGPSEFTITGTLKDWNVEPELPKINVPTLVLNGRHDEAQDFVVAPLFQLIPCAKWYTFAESSHFPHLEERERWMEVVSQFLTY